jgi:hypothetical protein
VVGSISSLVANIDGSASGDFLSIPSINTPLPAEAPVEQQLPEIYRSDELGPLLRGGGWAWSTTSTSWLCATRT